jgi:hypothetical protein
MPWIRNICVDAICGTCLGFVKGATGISLFTTEELDEVINLQKLALALIEKSPQVVTDDAICKAIREGQKSGLEMFVKNAPPELIATGLVTAAELVCNKSFKQRFGEVLIGACLNLVGC